MRAADELRIPASLRCGSSSRWCRRWVVNGVSGLTCCPSGSPATSRARLVAQPDIGGGEKQPIPSTSLRRGVPVRGQSAQHGGYQLDLFFRLCRQGPVRLRCLLSRRGVCCLVPVYKASPGDGDAALPRTLRTFDTCHRPPRAVRRPLPFKAVAMPRRLVMPDL
jgi:hypothetical protein